MVEYDSLPCDAEDDLETVVIFESSPSPTDVKEDDDVASPKEGEEEAIDESMALAERLKILARKALPCIASFFIGLLGPLINFSFAGHIPGTNSAEVLAGIALANMFANVTGISLMLGMTGGVETLGAQYNGSKQYEKVGYVLQRSIIALSVLSLPVLVLWLCSKDIFLFLGVSESVCVIIGHYLFIRAFEIPANILHFSYEKYLFSVGVMHCSFFASVIYAISVVTINWTLIYGPLSHLKTGYCSLGYAICLSQYVAMATQISTSLSCESVRRTLQKINFLAAMDGMCQFVSLGIPGTLMLISEWWAFECLLVMSSRFGTDAVAAQTIMSSTVALAFMIPLGLGVSTSSLVGNAIGAQKFQLAMDISKLAVCVILVLGLFSGALLVLFYFRFVTLFTSDPVVDAIADRSKYFMAVFVLFDGVQGVCSGVLRGAGKQSVGAVLNLTAFYVIGLPMAYLITFKLGAGVNGLLVGISVGTLFQACALLYLLFCRADHVYQRVVESSVGSKGEAEISSESAKYLMVANPVDQADGEEGVEMI